MAEMTQAEKEHWLRRMLFVPCDTKEHLHTWVKAYLGLDLPSSTVCHTDNDFEPSSSNPMDLLWEVYQAARSGDRSKAKFLFYAARGCYKSVIASVIEALCLFHLRRDVGHMAANKAQSKIVQNYLAQYLLRPVLRDFMTSKNQSEIQVTWFEDPYAPEPINTILTPAEYAAKTELEPDGYKSFVEKSFMVKVVVATLGGANGLHCSMMVMDELDLTPPEIISEALMIPAPGKEKGEPAMVLMTSSRKFAIGPVQDAIDTSHKTGMQVRHWNVIDVTKSCPTERHLPLAPRIPIYYSNDLLEAIGEDAYQQLPDEDRKKYQKDEGYEGCLKNCRIFAMCRGRLATEQKSDTPLLRYVEDTQEQFISQPDVEKAQAQLMCWKPSRAGMVYPRLSRKLHVITAARMAELMTGDEFPSTFGKGQLLEFFKTQAVRYYVGVDHGFNHCFAGVLGARWGNVMFVIDAFEIPGLELDGKVRVMQSRFQQFNPTVYADTSHPGDNKTIGRNGFRMKKWTKGPGSVVDGIGIVRMKMNPVTGYKPELYFLQGDPGVETLFERMLKYAWVIDTNTGEPTNEPNENGDDGPDALRYLVMNAFAPNGSLVTARPEESNPLAAPRGEPPQPTAVRAQHWGQIMGHVGMTIEDPLTGEGISLQPKVKGKKGGLVWDLG
jgi:hypothetical protein